MSSGEQAGESGGLNSEQQLLLESFQRRCKQIAEANPYLTGFFDQTSAHMRDALTGLKLDMDDPKVYYAVMGGLSLGTEWMQGLINRDGVSPTEAARVMQVSFDRVLPDAAAGPDGLV